MSLFFIAHEPIVVILHDIADGAFGRRAAGGRGRGGRAAVGNGALRDGGLVWEMAAPSKSCSHNTAEDLGNQRKGTFAGLFEHGENLFVPVLELVVVEDVEVAVIKRATDDSLAARIGESHANQVDGGE